MKSRALLSGSSFRHLVKRYPSQFHFLIMLLFVNVFSSLQAMVFARIDNPWFHFDLVTVVVVYFSVEHFLVGAFFRILYAAILMQTLSLAPPGFFMMYYLLALVFASLMSRVIILHSIISQFAVFSFIFLLKFVLLFFVLQRNFSTLLPSSFFWSVLPEIVGTTLITVPIFAFLAFIDSRFEYVAFRDRHKDRPENLV